MTISYAFCESILKTLPIGYYCGRRVSVTIDKEAETSYYNPMEDTITISFPIIAKGVEALPDGSDLEKAVRSMLYHETSHAILTPTNMIGYFSSKKTCTMINIFEDERIETILSNFYMNVDFKEQLFNITGGPSIPTDAMEVFYNVVRFRIGPDKYVNRVSEIINKYKKINRQTINWWEYFSDIDRLYDDIANHFKKHPEDFNSNQNLISNAANMKQMLEDLKSIIASEITDLFKDIGNAPNNGIKQIIQNGMDITSPLNTEQVKQINDLNKTLSMLFSNFNKKNSSGNGINAYSGVFNPRAVVRDDYRYFDRAINSNGNNKYGTIHLNLILDNSGSFDRNAPTTNAILTTLTAFERRNKNFTMDVYFINDKIIHADKIKDRYMVCNGGNRIPENTKDILRKAQKPNTYNYNIVLFDGDAGYAYKTNIAAKLFKVFDRKQTYMITDPENEKYLKICPFTSTKVIVTKNYNDELIKNLSKAFQTMLS